MDIFPVDHLDARLVRSLGQAALPVASDPLEPSKVETQILGGHPMERLHELPDEGMESVDPVQRAVILGIMAIMPRIQLTKGLDVTPKAVGDHDTAFGDALRERRPGRITCEGTVQANS